MWHILCRVICRQFLMIAHLVLSMLLQDFAFSSLRLMSSRNISSSRRCSSDISVCSDAGGDGGITEDADFVCLVSSDIMSLTTSDGASACDKWVSLAPDVMSKDQE